MTRCSKSADKIVLDLETKKGFDQINGQDYSGLGISVVGIFSYLENKFKVFAEDQILELKPYLQRCQLIIGFNIKRFDFPVLQPYLDFDLSRLNSLDILEEVKNSLGFRLSLNNLAQATLEVGKSGSGLDALKYYRQGEMEKLKQYCQHDVLITRQLYEYGRQHGQLLYFRGTSLSTVPASWSECQGVEATLQQAFSQRRTVEIEYASSGPQAQHRVKRRIDIYSFEFGRINAFCHLRQSLRTFNSRRILSAELTADHYQLPKE